MSKGSRFRQTDLTLYGKHFDRIFRKNVVVIDVPHEVKLINVSLVSKEFMTADTVKLKDADEVSTGNQD